MILVISGLLTGYFSADLSADALSFFRGPAFTSSNCFIRDLLCNCVILIYLPVYLFTKLFLWPLNRHNRSLTSTPHTRTSARALIHSLVDAFVVAVVDAVVDAVVEAVVAVAGRPHGAALCRQFRQG